MEEGIWRAPQNGALLEGLRECGFSVPLSKFRIGACLEGRFTMKVQKTALSCVFLCSDRRKLHRHTTRRSLWKARNRMRLDEGYFGGKPTKELLFIFGDGNRRRGCAGEETLPWCNFPEYSGYLVKVPAGICKLYFKTVQLIINSGLL